MEKLLRLTKRVIPKRLFYSLQPFYHGVLATIGAIRYNFPSRKLYVIGITGTKGKSTVSELVTAILEEAGHTVALLVTIRIKIADESQPNLYKMSMPGRFFIQKFLAQAVKEDCAFAVLEMTSEGAKMNRHKHIEMNALIFTNLSPEHIESHGSFEAYRDAKLLLKDALLASPKPNRILVANMDDNHGSMFLETHGSEVVTLPYSLKKAEPYVTNERGTLLTFEGISIHSPLPGTFNIYNILAAATLTRAIGIKREVIKRAVEKLSIVKGRVERIEEGQKFDVIVDYAHTADSLEKLYTSFPSSRKICVLGNCGGGRDAAKRPVMAKIAEKYCSEIILTNEDPYDEDPMKIIEDMQGGLEKKKATVILDRRLAIRHALLQAREHDMVIITGKGTDPYIMEANGKKTEWSDERVTREELHTLLNKSEEHDSGSDSNVQ